MCVDVPVQTNDPVTNICQAADKQLFTLVEWAKRIPHFSDLPLDDQVILLRAGRGRTPRHTYIYYIYIRVDYHSNAGGIVQNYTEIQ